MPNFTVTHAKAGIHVHQRLMIPALRFANGRNDELRGCRAFFSILLGPMHRYQSREFVIRAEAMAAFDIIRSATIINAELLNRAGELGVVAPGARADLIAVNGDPLTDISLLDARAST
jgi:hypothetical protein